MKVLVTAATKHGATGEIAAAVGTVLTERGIDTTVVPPEHVGTLEGYDAVVLGSAVYTGHWLEAATDLVDRCGPGFAGRPVWLFSSGPVGDPTRKLVQQMGADPVDLPAIRTRTSARDHHVFAGALDRKNLTFSQRVGLKVFPGLQGDFRDWNEISRWASGIADELSARA